MSNVEMNDQALPLGFVYTLEVVDQFGQVIDSRTCKTSSRVGINHVVGLIRGSAAPIANWYMGIYEVTSFLPREPRPPICRVMRRSALPTTKPRVPNGRMHMTALSSSAISRIVPSLR